MSEQAIQNKIIKFIESKGHYVRKIINTNKAGTPDLFCCVNGKFVALEVKTPQTRNNISELQKYNIEQIIKAQGLAYCVWSKEQVEDILETI